MAKRLVEKKATSLERDSMKALLLQLVTAARWTWPLVVSPELFSPLSFWSPFLREAFLQLGLGHQR
mgnify:CR=1 FL=1